MQISFKQPRQNITPKKANISHTLLFCPLFYVGETLRHLVPRSDPLPPAPTKRQQARSEAESGPADQTLGEDGEVCWREARREVRPAEEELQGGRTGEGRAQGVLGLKRLRDRHGHSEQLQPHPQHGQPQQEGPAGRVHGHRGGRGGPQYGGQHSGPHWRARGFPLPGGENQPSDL